jgi:hypothetical protein
MIHPRHRLDAIVSGSDVVGEQVIRLRKLAGLTRDLRPLDQQGLVLMLTR